jgi:hypothetical protein
VIVSDPTPAGDAALELVKDSIQAAGGAGAINDIALALAGQPPAKIDECAMAILRLTSENMSKARYSEVFVRGFVAAAASLIRERIVQLQSSGSGQA